MIPTIISFFVGGAIRWWDGRSHDPNEPGSIWGPGWARKIVFLLVGAGCFIFLEPENWFGILTMPAWGTAILIGLLYTLNLQVIGTDWSPWEDWKRMSIRYDVFPLLVVVLIQEPEALWFLLVGPVAALVYQVEIQIMKRTQLNFDSKGIVEFFLGATTTGGLYLATWLH